MKTKLGVSAGLIAAAMYFTGIFSGYIPLLLIAGYVLLAEENEWLRKSAVKAVVTLLCFNILTFAIGLIPDAFDLITSFIDIFGVYFSFSLVNNIVSFINNVIYFIRGIVFLVLGIRALHMGDLPLAKVDSLVNEHTKTE